MLHSVARPARARSVEEVAQPTRTRSAPIATVRSQAWCVLLHADVLRVWIVHPGPGLATPGALAGNGMGVYDCATSDSRLPGIGNG